MGKSHPARPPVSTGATLQLHRALHSLAALRRRAGGYLTYARSEHAHNALIFLAGLDVLPPAFCSLITTKKVCRVVLIDVGNSGPLARRYGVDVRMPAHAYAVVLDDRAL